MKELNLRTPSALAVGVCQIKRLREELEKAKLKNSYVTDSSF